MRRSLPHQPSDPQRLTHEELVHRHRLRPRRRRSPDGRCPVPRKRPSVPAGLSTHTQECNRGTGATYNNACVYKDRSGRYLWDDGPSIEGCQNDALPGNMNYILLFWPAGQWHDYCYHHGERAYGYTREACDARFYSLMYGLCSELGKGSQQFTWNVQANCVNAALLAREAVNVWGGPGFSRTSSLVDSQGKLTADELSPDLIDLTTSLLD
jgi:hypothetical protein